MVRASASSSDAPAAGITFDKDVVAVSGGHLPTTAAHGSIIVQGNNWVARTCERGNTKFIVCDRTQYKFRQLVNDNFRMLDHIISLRNAEVTRMLSAAAVARQEEDDDDPRAPKVAKKDVCDAHEILAVNVLRRDGTIVTVKVLSASVQSNRLQLELLEENIALLLEEPVGEPAEIPEIKQPNVHWRKKGTLLGTRTRYNKYFSRRTRQGKQSFAAWQNAVDKAAAALQALYEQDCVADEDDNDEAADVADDGDESQADAAEGGHD